MIYLLNVVARLLGLLVISTGYESSVTDIITCLSNCVINKQQSTIVYPCAMYMSNFICRT